MPRNQATVIKSATMSTLSCSRSQNDLARARVRCRGAGVPACRGLGVPGNRGAGVSRCRDVDAAGDTSWLDPGSCISPARCVAVGHRHAPTVLYAFRTLALGWNGKTWTFEKTINE